MCLLDSWEDKIDKAWWCWQCFDGPLSIYKSSNGYYCINFDFLKACPFNNTSAFLNHFQQSHTDSRTIETPFNQLLGILFETNKQQTKNTLCWKLHYSTYIVLWSFYDKLFLSTTNKELIYIHNTQTNTHTHSKTYE